MKFKATLKITAFMVGGTVWEEEAPIAFDDPAVLATAPSQILDRCKELGGFLRVISQDEPEIEFVPLNSIIRINIKVQPVRLVSDATAGDIHQAATQAVEANRKFGLLKGGGKSS